MNRRHVLLAALIVLAGLIGGSREADAGGSTFDFDALAYQPGERAFAWASVSWDHYDTLGRPEDGPYRAYLIPLDPDRMRPGNSIPPNAHYVADLEIHEEPYDLNGVFFGPHHATVEFVVPNLPPGEYELAHCNSPCTTTLGDITWGMLRIFGSDPAPTTTTTTTTTVAPTTTAPDLAVEPLVADDSSSGSSGPLLAAGVVALGLGLGLVGWRVRARGQVTPKPA